MNIAHLLPYSARFPLTKHNGRYELVLRLAREQVRNGHKVTIYSAPDSGKGIDEITWKSSGHDFKDKTQNNIANVKTALQNDSHDVYHSHFDYLHYFLAGSSPKPMLFTQHWFPNEDIAAAARFDTEHRIMAVPSTYQMAEEDARLGISTTDIIRQGIDLQLFKSKPQPAGERFIFVGRITPNKGVLEAAQLAVKTGQKLDIVGKVNNSDKAYWQQIEPLVDNDQIRYLGAKSQAELAELLPNAKALIFPSQAPEASPQVPIEVQACGTPVILSDVGATAEWLEDGKTGFIAASEKEYIEAIEGIGKINREDCRRFAEKFSLPAMAENYQRLYEKLLSSS